MRWMESQVEERMLWDAEVTERAYAELASSVNDQSRTGWYEFGFTDREQADIAAKTCLRYYGVEAGPVPDDVLDLDERLEHLCRPSGTMRRMVRLDEGWYTRAFGALLGTLDTGEAVALLPRGVRGYYYLDPKTHHRVRVNSQVAAHIKPEAVSFYRPLPQKPLSIRDLVKFIFSVFDRQDYLLVFAAALLVTLVGMLPVAVNQITYGVVIPSKQVELIAPIGALLLGVSVSSVALGICRNLIMARVTQKMEVASEAATFARLLVLPASFFKEYASGNLAMRVSQVTMLTQLITTLLLGSGLTCLMSVIYLVQISAFASTLVLPALLIVLLQAAFTVFATLVTARYEQRTLDANAKLSGTVTALLNGISKVKLAGAEDRAFGKWAHGYAEYARSAYNRPAFVRAIPAIVTIIGLLGVMAIYYLAGSARVSLADYMSFNAAYGQMSAAIMGLAQAASMIAQIGPMLEMVEPILKATPETAEDKPGVEELSGAIEAVNISFRYNPESPYVVKNLSFKVHPGEYVGLVGKSGCGKSTIMRLLLGFEKPERGNVFYGIYDVQKTDLRSLRRNIGTVMQDGKLFMGDLASNISISTPLATLDDVWEAAEIAGIADDIRKMPMGMQTIVTEGGGGVSGGQRQRIMIARAVCGHRKILMFDEATSALDNKTQKHVSDSLDKLKCTRLVVAHRLSTVRHCDRILVVDNGAIAEEGTYEELIARGGIFAELVRRQRLEEEG